MSGNELKLKVEISEGLRDNEDVDDGIRVAATVIKLMAQYQPASGTHARFIGALMGGLVGATVMLLGKECTVLMLEQLTKTAREAKVTEAPKGPLH